MRRPGRWFWIIVSILAMVATHGLTYWIGHRRGLSERGPDMRALVVLTKTPGRPNSTGRNLTWFDVRKPAEAARLRAEETRLKSTGADFYVAKGVFESTLNLERDPRRVNAHR